VARRRGGEPLPAGAVVPSLSAPNITDVALVGRAVAAVLARLGGRTGRVSLVIPDTVAKVSLVRFEHVPAGAADLLELVRWQMRKSAPFPLEQAVVSHTPGCRPAEGGREFIVSVARSDVIAQYESACVRAGAEPGLVDLATFSVINGVLAGRAAPAGDWLVVHATPTYASLAVMREADVIFFRNRADETEGTLADVVHQTAMYYVDRLNGTAFTRVLLAGASALAGGADPLGRSLEERLGVVVEHVDPRSSVSVADHASSADQLDALAPIVGILLRERKAA
jgi:type IV pilus assembly protein PilM